MPRPLFTVPSFRNLGRSQPDRIVSFKIGYSMPMYRVYRMKDVQRQQFRWAPHVAGAAGVKARDYEPEGEVQAESEYDAWSRLRTSARPLAVGDLLESDTGQLR